jgi:uncharacterized membrane-anchored protein
MRILWVVVSIVLTASHVHAKPFAEMFPGVQFEHPEARTFVESVDYRQGPVPIGMTGVRLNVPPNFYFLSESDARRVLTEAWGNPPSAVEGVLGMILPADKTPVDNTWGVIIRYDHDGYVSDEDAAHIDYTNLLAELQQSTNAENEERKKGGFPAIELIGWAAPPFCDKDTHKLHWAKELKFGDEPAHTLNYDIRVLGRRGVLKLNFVAGMSELEQIRTLIPTVMAIPEFEDGSKYADFIPGTDTVAAYGIGGLVAGKAAAKLGLIALAAAFLKKGWILVVLAISGVFGWLKRRLFGSRQRSPDASQS